jgi:tetratricopeptide (TPR) repeat protein
MYVRRNYREPFFREKSKTPSILRRFFFTLVLILALGGFALWQQDMVLNVASEYLGPETTPTPLPGELARQAQDLFWLGDLQASADVWERVVAMRPDNVDYLYEYSMILIDLDDTRNGYADMALDFAEQILEIDPNDPRGYSLRARALVWTENYSLAISVAQAGIDISPTFAPLHEALSRAYIGDGQLRLGQEEGILAIEYGERDVRSYWAYASALAYSGAREEAITEYERTISVNPSFLPPYFELANNYLAANRDQEAIDTYTEILGVQPRNSRALLRQCQAYRKIGQFEQARGLCQDAVNFDPSYVLAQYQMALINYRDYDFIAADRGFQACVDLESDHLQCTYYLGLTQYYLAKAEYDNVCVPNRMTSFDCQARSICQTAWDLLERSLASAETLPDTEGDREIIRTGLIAIQDDPACQGVSGRPIPTLVPEATAEATQEASSLVAVHYF